jgi:BirA family biotin operon repressor/biotin-[acetyl-CoA-carboxylase] ligase
MHKFASLESTSTYVKTHLQSLPLRGVVVAKEQTGGRGQFGRQWESPLGGIYMTLFFPWPPHLMPPREMSLDAARLLKQILVSKGVNVHLKWPNDLLIEGKKVGGILTEILDHTIIIGIGLNVNLSQEAFIKVDQPATSLLIETGREWELDPLIEEIGETLLRELPKE